MRLPLAACTVGAHYLDLADGRDFVAGFAANVDAAAQAAGVLAVSGASSLPGLSSAVVDHLAKGLSRLDAIRIGIAPGQQAPRGVATIKAVFGYAGKPFARWNGGRWITVHGWQDIRTLGFNTLGNRWGAACDVPDLALFPTRYAGVQDVEFHAALELRVQHLALWLAATLHRWGVPLPIARHAESLEKIAKMLLDPFGSDDGGMTVRVEGLDLESKPARHAWHLFAGAGHGPEIPCMATLLLACKLARGELTQTGALPCVGLLQLQDFEAEFRRWGFTWVLIEEEPRQPHAGRTM